MTTIIEGFTGRYAFLSNFYGSPFYANDIKYRTVEHWFQAHKSLEFHDYIRQAGTPKEAKARGRKTKLRSDWEIIKTSVMLEGLVRKFQSSEILSSNLLNTYTAILVEGNHWHDNFWGNCYCKNCLSIEGKNILGQLLMVVRSNLVKSYE